jgi:hypothetical protein
MQNRYAGDVGDFMKFGLLRHLAASPEAGGAGLSVGLNWYLAPDEDHNADGKHIAYLDPSNRQHQSLAACDSDLMERLAKVVETGRSVEALDVSGALPPDAPVHSGALVPRAGLAGRDEWHARALDALAGAQVVCADPDNGICSLRQTPRLHKYALIGELADYARRGQSLVVYQHADRSADARSQATRRLDEVAAGVAQTPVAAVIARRGSCRFFLVTAAAAHRDQLARALRCYAAKWSPHAEVVYPGTGA